MTTDHIIQTLSAHLNVPKQVFTNRCRLRTSNEARQLAMYFINKSGLNLRQTGLVLGGRKPETVWGGVNRIAGYIEFEKGYRERVSQIEKLIIAR